MSDFYRRRRVIIKDSTALLTFFLGFVWSGAFAWPFLADQVDQGDMTRGLAYFLAAVLGTGLVTGVIGLETGNLLGGLWERYHRHHRGLASPAGHRALAWAGGPQPWETAMPAPILSRPSPRSSDAGGVYYTQAGVYAASFMQLSERVRPDKYELPRVREALSKTINIGAWDGGRLVGVVRVLTDGYTFSAVADILVDPEYQRLGIGRNLMKNALAAAPGSDLVIDARPDCVGFFERVGCDRGPTGFRLTRPVLQ